MSSEDKLTILREQIYKDYEFWLGCYNSDKGTSTEGDHWKSGMIHAYRNVLAAIDGDREFSTCPCHVCVELAERRKNR